ncbi:MAG: RIP metalloprotease RseP [Eubacteriaceae bacterium]|nr:RIP metalloprotease RseP [Eubacteriaceae bacterium]
MTIIYAIIMFCILIFIHELGHFIAAKSCGVQVNQFALGMGPAFFKKKWGETEYSLRILPIGGFCAMEGEDEDSENPRAFNRKKAWQKAIIVCAGAAMNIILAIILMCIVTYSIGVATTAVGTFVKGSKAEQAGLQKGDKIVQIDDKKINEWDDVSGSLDGKKKGDAVTIIYKRDGETKTLNTTLMESQGKAMIGISPIMKKDAGAALKTGFTSTWGLTKSMYKVIKQLFTGQVSTKELSGPVGIVYMVNKSAENGMIYILYLMALISLNLGIFNMLPFPALDGGRLVFIIIRRITGKAITDSMEAKVNFAGLMLLFGLMIYVTWNDIVRFIVPHFQ